jgi:hypothetical protein
LLSSLFISVHALADTATATPYRPTAASPAGLSAPGWLDVEIGIDHSKGTGRANETTLPAMVKLALDENWGLLANGNLYTVGRDDGWHYQGVGDLQLTLKHRITTQDEDHNFGWEIGTLLPTGADAVGEGKPKVVVNGIYSVQLGEYTIDFNLGATGLGMIEDGKARLQKTWAGALSRSINDDTAVFAGLSGISQRGARGETELMFGTSYSASKRLIFDAGVTFGLASASPDYHLFAGVTVLGPRLW